MFQSGGYVPVRTIGVLWIFPGFNFQQNLTKLLFDQVVEYCNQTEFF